MLVESRNIISGEPLYVIKNNSMEAVLLPFEVYENLHSLEELLGKDYKANSKTVNFKAFEIML